MRRLAKKGADRINGGKPPPSLTENNEAFGIKEIVKATRRGSASLAIRDVIPRREKIRRKAQAGYELVLGLLFIEKKNDEEQTNKGGNRKFLGHQNLFGHIVRLKQAWHPVEGNGPRMLE